MNWTGGALSRSRHSNAKASLSIKQKNHFAKARVKLQNGQRPCPPEVQYFDFGEWKPESGKHHDQRSKSAEPRVAGQRTLDQFQNVQGVVRKLKSIRPRNDGDRRKRSVINDTEGHVLSSGIAVPPISPITISSRSPSSSSSAHSQPTPEQNAKRLRTSPSSPMDEADPLAVTDSVEAKRRRLLLESDWVGIERQRCMSKPLKMKFADAEDRDLIGRRRPLNGTAIQNRWNVRGSRPMKMPLAVPNSRKPFREEGCCGADEISIRIGSTATSNGPIANDVLDRYQSSRFTKCSSYPPKALNHDNVQLAANPQHQRREFTTPSASRDETSEPFRSLFSPEEVEQSGIAQIVEAATVADAGDDLLAMGELQLPEDYHFPEPGPAFRLVSEQRHHPQGYISSFDDRGSPIEHDLSYPDRQLPGISIEHAVLPEDRNVLEDQIAEYAPVQDADQGTSPLSIATSRYMQELESQSLGFRGPRFMAKDMANRAAAAKAQPPIDRSPAKEKQGTISNREPKISVQPDDVQDKENIQPTEDEDEIWREFINLENVLDVRSSQEELPSTHIPNVVEPKTSFQQIPDQTCTESATQKAPLLPQDDDELIWKNFIFSDSISNNDWVLEEAEEEAARLKSTSSSSPISTRNHRAGTQPSMVAEVATSPMKQNPHLIDDGMFDDDSTLVLDNASRYAHAATRITDTEPTGTPQQTSYSPRPQSSIPAPTSSPAPLSSQTPSNATPLPPPPPNPHPQNPKPPSSLLAQASSSSSSCDPLSWTPSRLPLPTPTPAPISTTTTTPAPKILFNPPSRYIGSNPPLPVHVGRKSNPGKGHAHRNANPKPKGKKTHSNTTKEERKKKAGKERSLADAVERARGRVEVGMRTGRSTQKREEDGGGKDSDTGREGEQGSGEEDEDEEKQRGGKGEEEEQIDRDDIIDD